MNFLYYFLKKLLYACGVIVGVTFMVFIVFHVAIGDPTDVLLGKYATPEAMALLRTKLGLDRPWYVQYWDVLQSAFTFDFGYAWSSQQHILTMFCSGALVSLTIELPAFLISNILVISVALYMTQYQRSVWDRLLVTFCVVMNSIPFLIHVLIAQNFFAYKLGLFEITGYEHGFPACIPYIILPVCVSTLYGFCYDYRFYRSIMLDQIYQDYVRTARAKGLPQQVVLFKHVLKNVMAPIVTKFIKELPSLIVGSVLIENFFGIPGLGNTILNAIHSNDFPIIKAITVIIAVLNVLCSIIGDVLYALFDPRVRL